MNPRIDLSTVPNGTYLARIVEERYRDRDDRFLVRWEVDEGPYWGQTIGWWLLPKGETESYLFHTRAVVTVSSKEKIRGWLTMILPEIHVDALLPQQEQVTA